MKLLQSSPPHFLFWLPYLSFFYYKLQQSQESFLPEAISMPHQGLSPEQKGINFTNVHLSLVSFPRVSPKGLQTLLPRVCKAQLQKNWTWAEGYRFQNCSRMEAERLSFHGQGLRPSCPTLALSLRALPPGDFEGIEAVKVLRKPESPGSARRRLRWKIMQLLNETVVTSATKLGFIRDIVCSQV